MPIQSYAGTHNDVSRWKAVYEADYTALSPQNLKIKEVATIDGKNYNILNTQKASVFEVGPDGLRIVASGTGNVYGGSYTAPGIKVRIEDLVPLSINQGIRVSAHVELVGTPSGSNEALISGLKDYNNGGLDQTVWFGGPVVDLRPYAILGALSKTDPDLVAQGFNVLSHSREGHKMAHSFGIFGSQWPEKLLTTKSAINQYFPRISGPYALSYVFAFERTGGTGITEIRLKRLKVEVCNLNDEVGFFKG